MTKGILNKTLKNPIVKLKAPKKLISKKNAKVRSNTAAGLKSTAASISKKPVLKKAFKKTPPVKQAKNQAKNIKNTKNRQKIQKTLSSNIKKIPEKSKQAKQIKQTQKNNKKLITSKKTVKSTAGKPIKKHQIKKYEKVLKKSVVKSSLPKKPFKSQPEIKIKLPKKLDQTASKKASPVSKSPTQKPTAIKIKKEKKMKPQQEVLSKELQQHFREILWDSKKQLQSEMERTIHHLQDEAANFADPNDRATHEEEFSLELRTRDRERKLIKKIDEALQRLEAQDYGYCEKCGINIDIKRLEVRPTATMCVDCKQLEEIREKHFN